MIIILFCLSVFLAYFISTAIVFGIQQSMSATYYCFKENRQFIFSAFCLLSSVPLLKVTDSYLLDGAIMCMAMVGVAAAYKGDAVMNAVHMTFAYSSVLLGQLSIYFDVHLIWLNIVSVYFSIVLILLRSKLKGAILFVEVLNYISIIYTLILLQK